MSVATMTSINVAIRQTCDACNLSKVKCDGGFPCSRCSKRGTQCFYRPKKRRPKYPVSMPEIINTSTVVGSKNDSAMTISTTTKAVRQQELNPNHPAAQFGFANRLDSTQLPKSLNEYERRIWTVFFTLFKNFGASCSAFWFAHQLRKMSNFLQERSGPALERFNAWLVALNIEITPDFGRPKCGLDVSMVRLRVLPSETGIPVVQDMSEVFDVEVEARAKNLATIRLDELGNVTCNDMFVQEFGVTADDLNGLLGHSGGGLLPWGGDLVCRIMPKESEIMAFIQIMAMKINGLGKPKEIPCIREVPSLHIVTVANSKDVLRQCVMKTLHREIITTQDDGKICIAMQLLISFTFMPDANTDHGKLRREVINMPTSSSNVINTKSSSSSSSSSSSVPPPLASPSNSGSSVTQSSSLYFQKFAEEDNTDESEGFPSGVSVVTQEEAAGGQDLLASDFLGNDERWLDELLDWVGTDKGPMIKEAANQDPSEYTGMVSTHMRGEEHLPASSAGAGSSSSSTLMEELGEFSILPLQSQRSVASAIGSVDDANVKRQKTS